MFLNIFRYSFPRITAWCKIRGASSLADRSMRFHETLSHDVVSHDVVSLEI